MIQEIAHHAANAGNIGHFVLNLGGDALFNTGRGIDFKNNSGALIVVGHLRFVAGTANKQISIRELHRHRVDGVEFCQSQIACGHGSFPLTIGTVVGKTQFHHRPATVLDFGRDMGVTDKPWITFNMDAYLWRFFVIGVLGFLGYLWLFNRRLFRRGLLHFRFGHAVAAVTTGVLLHHCPLLFKTAANGQCCDHKADCHALHKFPLERYELHFTRVWWSGKGTLKMK